MNPSSNILLATATESSHHLNILLLLGIAVFGGTIGARNTFATQELNDWLVALDIMEPAVAQVTPQMPLSEAFNLARRYNLDCLPVVRAEGQDALVGVLDCPAIRRSLSSEVLSRQEKADNIHGMQCA